MLQLFFLHRNLDIEPTHLISNYFLILARWIIAKCIMVLLKCLSEKPHFATLSARMPALRAVPRVHCLPMDRLVEACVGFVSALSKDDLMPERCLSLAYHSMGSQSIKILIGINLWNKTLCCWGLECSAFPFPLSFNVRVKADNPSLTAFLWESDKSIALSCCCSIRQTKIDNPLPLDFSRRGRVDNPLSLFFYAGGRQMSSC